MAALELVSERGYHIEKTSTTAVPRADDTTVDLEDGCGITLFSTRHLLGGG